MQFINIIMAVAAIKYSYAHESCMPEIEVEFNGNSIDATSSKDLSNVVVYDGCTYKKYDSLTNNHGTFYSPNLANDVCIAWIKSGCNQSNDGPGYGEKFTNDEDCKPKSCDNTTPSPSISPTKAPTRGPSKSPTLAPTKIPTRAPSNSPTLAPSKIPTRVPSSSPTLAPSNIPTRAPSNSPTLAPSKIPTHAPSNSPTLAPSKIPTRAPSNSPTLAPSNIPTRAPSSSPTLAPSNIPTRAPSSSPTLAPSKIPTRAPSSSPTLAPSAFPTHAPSHSPTLKPTAFPTNVPSSSPTLTPTAFPTTAPSKSPTLAPTRFPTTAPSHSPTLAPTAFPTHAPSKSPTLAPTRFPTKVPSHSPTKFPTRVPTNSPTVTRYNNLLIIVDYSTSMSLKGLQRGQSYIENGLTCARPRSMALIGFDHAAWIAAGWTQSVNNIENTINALLPNPNSQTNLFSGLSLAKNVLGANSKRDTIVMLFSDGKANLPGKVANAKKRAIQAARYINGDSLAFYCIAVGEAPDYGFLNKLCSKVFHVSDPAKPSLCLKL